METAYTTFHSLSFVTPVTSPTKGEGQHFMLFQYSVLLVLEESAYLSRNI